MSDTSGEGNDAVLTDFLEAFLADREHGVARSLDDYLLRFPGHAEAIAKEFLSLRQGNIATGDAAGDRIGHYRVLDEIGRGGQGIVYLAEDTRLHRKVALKVLKEIGSLSEDPVARFRREAEAASRLDHPGICAVYEAALDGKVPYIAMRLVEGESLAAKIASAKSQCEASVATSFVHLAEVEVPVPPRPATDPSPTPSGPTTRAEIMRIVHLIEKTARALHAAHEAGVLHRDMKPGNVMVTPEGEPVIMDFGLAYLEDEQLPTLTQTGEFVGTPAYMAPEQLFAQRVRLDRRTDVWSLGVMLYECVTLTRPFDAPTRAGVYQAIQTRQPLDPRRINRSVPDEIRVVIETALEKDRDRRYQTALDFAEELRRVRCFEPIRARRAGSILRFRRWAQRNPVLATAVGGLFAVLTVGLATALVFLGRSERDRAEKDVALREKDVALREKDVALREKTAALTDYDRLGDLSRLQKLVAEAGELWPAEPSKVAEMNSWVDQASDLEKRLAGHREVRDRLRTSTGLLPYTDADRGADVRAHAADQEQLAKLRANREMTAAALATKARTASRPPGSTGAADSGPASHPSLADLRTTVARLDAEIQRIDARIHERLTWKFESSADQFKHDTAAKLVADLMAFRDQDPRKGVLSDVRARLAFAESIERETIGKYETKWADAIRSIADKAECPKYDGLEIKRQLGLIPIGKDPASGLHEFAHLQTTAPGTDPIPKRDKNGKIVVTESMGIVFVLIPAGTFKMGAVKPDEDQAPTEPNIDPEATDSESPITEIRLDPFFLSKYEMTQGQWLRLVGKNRSRYEAGTVVGGKLADLRNPVENMSWEDCDQWVGRLGLTLPTEAQWEYAARGGTTTPRWTGLGTDGLAKAGNLADAYCRQNGGSSIWKYEAWNDGYTVHAPVGSFSANPFGLHDVLGNVWEWCRDWFGEYDVTARSGDGLRSPSVSRTRVGRGGCWGHESSVARSASRTAIATVAGGDGFLGVRPARPCRLD